MISRLKVGLLALTLGCPSGAAAQGLGGETDAIAQRLVASAGVREGDFVQITGGTRDAELLESVAVHVRRTGAHPLISLASERMVQRMFEKVPARYDTQAPAFDMKLAETVTVQINVDAGEDPSAFAGVPASRRAAVAKAGEPIGKLLVSRNVRQLFLGNGLYPTKRTAEMYGVSQEELSKIFWEGVAVDPAKLQATADALKGVLAAGREIRITHPNGTDLKARIDGRPALVSDGVISPEEVKRGGAACQVWLPAGEVYLVPMPGTAEGRVVVDSQVFDGKPIPGFTLTFKAGKLEAMTATSGLETLKALYDATGAGKDVLGAIDFGINPNVRIPPGSRLATWVPAGMVSLAVGNNLWAGGDNVVAFGMPAFLPGTTVTVDGKPVVEKGVLKF